MVARPKAQPRPAMRASSQAPLSCNIFTKEKGEDGLSLLSRFPCHYKSVAHLFLWTEPPYLPLPLPVSYINTPTSHISLCLSLNSFWAET